MGFAIAFVVIVVVVALDAWNEQRLRDRTYRRLKELKRDLSEFD